MAFKPTRIQRLSAVIGISMCFFIAEISGKIETKPPPWFNRPLTDEVNAIITSRLLHTFVGPSGGRFPLRILS